MLAIFMGRYLWMVSFAALSHGSLITPGKKGMASWCYQSSSDGVL